MRQSPVIFDLCLRKTRSGKSRDYRDVIIFEKLRFQTDILKSVTGALSKACVFVTD